MDASGYNFITNIEANTIVDKDTRNHLKELGKDLISQYLAEQVFDEIDNNSQKVYLAMLMYSKLKTHLDSEIDLPASIEFYIESIVDISYHAFTRFKKRFPNKFKFLIEDIEFMEFTLGEFILITDEQIENMFIKARDSLVLEPREDEIFSLSLFNNANDAIIVKNKIGNLKQLHNTVLLPIILYYKRKMELSGSILIVEEGISNRTQLQQQGKAVIFRINGVERAIIIEDLRDRNIDVEFGLVRNHGTSGLFISIPYDAEGRTVRRLVDGNKDNW